MWSFYQVIRNHEKEDREECCNCHSIIVSVRIMDTGYVLFAHSIIVSDFAS